MAIIFQFTPTLEPKPDVFDDEIEAEFIENWEKFVKIAQAAYEWRDMESVEELEALLARIKPFIERTLPQPDAAVEPPRPGADVIPFRRV